MPGKVLRGYIKTVLLPKTIFIVGDSMKKYFTFQSAPMTIVVALIVMSWLSFLSVVLFGEFTGRY